MSVETFKPAELRIPAERVLRMQGYTDPQRVRRPIREAARGAALAGERLAEPEVRYRRVALESCVDGELRLSGGTMLYCPAFPRFLSGCQQVVVFVLTAGNGIDEELARLNDEEKLLEMLLLETAGWLAVEQITKAFSTQLRRLVKEEGLKLTRRLGPGYSYGARDSRSEWSLSEQRPLVGLLDDGRLPVTVLESCAMIPKMSRSGLMGLAPLASA